MAVTNNKPIKVLWFTNTPSLAADMLSVPTIGGGWINSLEAKIKEREGVELAVAFKHGDEELKKMSSHGTTYFAIPYEKRNRVESIVDRHVNRLDDTKLLDYCQEVINDFKPDIINIFGTEEGFGLVVDKVKTPVVIHLQGILTVYQLKWFSANINKVDLLRHNGVKDIITGNSLYHNYSYFRKAAAREQKIFKKCHYFMGRTDWDRRITSILAPQSTYFRSEEILRKNFYSARWTKQTEDKKRFISTIQANIYKGLETVLESAVLLKELNLFDFEWLVVGTPADHILIQIFEKKTQKKFSNFNVVFVGKVGAEQLVEIELSADIFIHPSHIDNSPNSICEAMLLGMPIIATCSGGTGSLIVDGEDGVLVQDGDPYAITGAILELVKDPAYSIRLGEKARERGLKRNDPDTIVDNVLDIYSSILNH